jgi:hypothetical protein
MWLELRNRFSDFIDTPDSALDRLIHQIISPNGGGPVSVLKSAAIAAEVATTAAEVSVGDQVRLAVLSELERLYSPKAVENYQTIAKNYNAACERFTKASKAVDLERDGNSLIGESPETMAIWASGPALVADVRRWRHCLLPAASLCPSIPNDVAFIGGGTDLFTVEWQISLSMDAGRAHRRKVWELVIDEPGRTGGFHQLVSLGVKLGAPPTPNVKPYAQPEPLIPVYERNGTGRYWDPHDGKLPAHMRPMKVGWELEPIKNIQGAD